MSSGVEWALSRLEWGVSDLQLPSSKRLTLGFIVAAMLSDMYVPPPVGGAVWSMPMR